MYFYATVLTGEGINCYPCLSRKYQEIGFSYLTLVCLNQINLYAMLITTKYRSRLNLVAVTFLFWIYPPL